MDINTFEKAIRLKSLIDGEERNIKGWEELFKAEEITITSATKPQNMYLTGDKKEKVKEIIISENKQRLAKYKHEFENL
ncbi:hypothetical protein PU629_06345 [Pullulanibacillus sp. KACC 23026]|uniref:hypothetical protein n=1 Tax=Pullulanibacillus sp. KACC 23026 TaxID=3028315 RepID=UPI0023AF6E08|nr:hypothetical protein [Pullulanibacillus sp. KACC 23026]WEG13984.1 hypothetical protein PU629_06345 [Pullulanibacillus sp. KACC 23026]